MAGELAGLCGSGCRCVWCVSVWTGVYVCFYKSVSQGVNSCSAFSLRNSPPSLKHLLFRRRWHPGSRGQEPSLHPHPLPLQFAAAAPTMHEGRAPPRDPAPKPERAVWKREH